MNEWHLVVFQSLEKWNSNANHFSYVFYVCSLSIFLFFSGHDDCIVALELPAVIVMVLIH